MVDVDAGRFASERVRTLESLLVDDERTAAGREHPLDDGQPVVRLVVEDSVSDASGLVLPGPHEGRAMVRGEAERMRRIASLPYCVERTLQRPGTLGLHRVDAGHGRERAERDALLEGVDARTCERPTTDLHDKPIGGDAGGDDLPPQRLASLDRKPVQRALTRERQRALVNCMQEPPVRRISGDPVSVAHGDLRAELLEAAEDDLIGVRRDEHAKRAFDAVETRGNVEEALGYAAHHRSAFMWPWEEEPRSIAHGILDDETYDWLAVVEGMLATGGRPFVAGEDTLVQANAVAQETTGIDVDPTGSAGLAGLLALRAAGEVGDDERVAVLFTGVTRRSSSERKERSDEKLSRPRHSVAQGLRAR